MKMFGPLVRESSILPTHMIMLFRAHDMMLLVLVRNAGPGMPMGFCWEDNKMGLLAQTLEAHLSKECGQQLCRAI